MSELSSVIQLYHDKMHNPRELTYFLRGAHTECQASVAVANTSQW